MAENNEGSPFTIPTTFVLVAAAAVAWYHYVRPLTSSRPSAMETNQPAMGDQTVRARLWEDPFEAVAKGEARTAAPSSYELRIGGTGLQLLPHPADESDSRELSRVCEKLKYKERTLILPVMVSNAPYADESEWRRRCRYAVVSALSTARFIPADSLHLGRFSVKWPDADARIDAQTLTVPYEWFQRNSNSPAHQDWEQVLVLWLDDDLFSDVPLSRMVHLLDQLLPTSNANRFAREPRCGCIGCAVIGPDNSTTLKALLNDPLVRPSRQRLDILKPHWDKQGIRQVLRAMRWFSPRATASNASLLNALGSEPGTCSDILFGDNGTDGECSSAAGAALSNRWLFQVTRTTSSDLELMRTMVAELQHRGVDLRPNHDHVALITEQDTVYGREIERAFRSAAAECQPDFDANDTIHTHRYLRGLDGATSEDERTARSSQTDPSGVGRSHVAGLVAEQKVPLPPPNQPESPDGNRQYDYMRRIADVLSEEEREFFFSANDSGAGYRAIGVLGTDVYDKLLVLRALHDRFPRAIFFTTDLDNRLFQAQEQESTRNLVVTGGYGLTLAPKLQRDVPPFRDGYQTATYATCLEALGFGEGQGAMPVIHTSPRIFEVSRDGYADLSAAGGGIYPSPRQPLALQAVSQTVLWILPMIGLSVWLLFPALPRLRRLIHVWPLGDPADRSPLPRRETRHAQAVDRLRSMERSGDQRALYILMAYVVLVITILLLMRFAWRNGGEPADPFSGVSVWPTEMIRLFAAFLAVLFIFRANEAMKYNEFELSVSYDLGTEEPKNPLPPAGATPSRIRSHVAGELRKWLGKTVSNWENRCTRFRQDERLIEEPGRLSRATMPELWREYLWLGMPDVRCWRVIPLTIAFTAVAWLAQWYWGPPFRPYRTWTGNYTDLATMALSGVLVIFMTLWIVDSIRLCEAFCSNLAGRQTPWDDQQTNRFASERHMNQQDVQQWLDIEFIADRTKVVGRFILYPFVVLGLLIISRSRVFGRWDWPIPLIVNFGILCVYGIWCIIMLRRAAERARADAVEEMEKRLVYLRSRSEPQWKSRSSQVRLAIQAIKDNKKGAFAPLRKHPLVGAVLIPASGAAALALIEFLTSPS